MNLYLIIRKTKHAYGQYSDAVVAAESSEEATLVHPDTNYSLRWDGAHWLMKFKDGSEVQWEGEWVNPKDVRVKLIGTAAEGISKGAICSSFHAG